MLADRERRRNMFIMHDDDQYSENDDLQYSCDEIINTQAEELEKLCYKVESLENNKINDSMLRK